MRWIAAGRYLRRSRAEVIRLAVEHCVEDLDDLSVAIDRLRDLVLDWTRSGVCLSIRTKESAAKELRRVAKPDRARIVAAIDGLAETPHLAASEGRPARAATGSRRRQPRLVRG